MDDLLSIAPAFKTQLRAAQLEGLAQTVAWTVNGTNRQNAYATHGVFRYFGKYPPPIGRSLIQSYTREGDLVLDPTCGSGTTGVESLLLSRRAVQFDVSPMSVSVATVKATHLPESETTEVLDDILARSGPLSESEYPVRPVGLRNPDHWFLPQTCDSLRGLHRAVFSLSAGPVRRLFEVAFLGTVRRVSRATTQQGRLFLDANSASEDARPTFERVARRAIKAVCQLPEEGQVTTSLHDSRLPILIDEPAKLCILHPPYFNAYKYSRINSLELAWMGVPAKEVRPQEVREYFKVGKAENAEKYVVDMAKVVCSAVGAVESSGVISVMIGDTRLKDVHIPVTRMLIDRVTEALPLRLEQVVLRIPKHTEASWVASQRRKAGALGVSLCDYVITFRKTAS